MTQITVDSDMLAKLHGLSGPLVFCDEQGHVLGRFEPSEPRQKPHWEPMFSKEELDAMENERGGRSLSEILAELRSHR